MPDVQNLEPTQSLDALLWADDPHATMHDAELLCLEIDYSASRAALTLVICVGDPDSDDESVREACRPGKLLIEGLRTLSIEKPERFEGSASRKGLWIDADLGGRRTNLQVSTGDVSDESSAKGIRFWIYVNDWDSIMAIECDRVEFVGRIY